MNASPKITQLTWGRMEIEGIGSGKDFKLWPGGGREWDWSETGTHHSPGIQITDVEELLQHGARVIVLSRGKFLRLKTCPETLRFLETEGLSYHVAESEKAAQIYNDLVAHGEAACGLFHSTC